MGLEIDRSLGVQGLAGVGRRRKVGSQEEVEEKAGSMAVDRGLRWEDMDDPGQPAALAAQ